MIEKLKARAFDLVRQQQMIAQQLQALHAEIVRLESAAQPAGEGREELPSAGGDGDTGD